MKGKKTDQPADAVKAEPTEEELRSRAGGGFGTTAPQTEEESNEQPSS